MNSDQPTPGNSGMEQIAALSARKGQQPKQYVMELVFQVPGDPMKVDHLSLNLQAYDQYGALAQAQGLLSTLNRKIRALAITEQPDSSIIQPGFTRLPRG